MKKSKYLPYKHPFRFQIDGQKPVTFWAKVIAATKSVSLRLTAADVRRSIKLRGAGNTQTCSMALCAKRQASAFPHAVEGYIDWTYSRAHVVTKTRADGTPAECVVYTHGDNIAHLNDEKGGQIRLLEDLLRNGDREITLRSTPPKKKKTRRAAITGAATTPTPTRVRNKPAVNLKGANRRFAVAQLGGATV